MRTRPLRLVALALGVLAAAPAPAHAALTASKVSVQGQRAYVRVVIDFTGASVNRNAVHATDPKPADGAAAVEITDAVIAKQKLDVKRLGLRARLSVSKRPTKARVQMFVTPRKFKYVRIAVAQRQLVIELYRTAPPSRATEILSGRNTCLTLTSVQGSGTSFVVNGTEHNVFEGSFVIRVRDMTGLVVGTHIVTARGAWSQTVKYTVDAAGSGTLEAVAVSKEGALTCLVQVRVALRA